MKYISTRGHVGQPANPEFCDILLGGLAPDGGLYLPESYPRIGRAELDAWRSLSYAGLAFEILSRFITDIPAADLKAICDKTYTADVYRHARPGDDTAKITPVHWLEQGRLGLLELSNGPTLAFKDMAMQLLGNLFEYVLAKRGESINILGATSGDTGSAAEYAMRGKQGVRVFMLSPHGKMSAFQRAQMYSLQDENIFNIAVTGMFDDAQDIVKAVSNDLEFKAKYKIGAVNSINWARVAAQVVYYFKGYFEATTSNDQQVAFCVPSGNFGNICAGHIARMMGLPVAKLILATNENDVLDEFFRTGVYRPRKTAETRVTSSPSMDISKASNFERFVFDLVGRDPRKVAALWTEVDAGRPFDLSASAEFARIGDFAFASGSSSHADRLATIGKVFEQYGVMIDTHTADGVKVAWEQIETIPADVPVLVLETALPVKFAETIREALGRDPEVPADLQGLEALPQRVEVMAPDLEQIKRFIVERV
ncbi:threonine synthase [Parazoarcus communis]|uniref:Threonine synthase n=2 Tax=Parazoarcus communis TaxID=41977 RepID=A0A323UVB1_9RHOO|nr:threonine synthase [Parazoarcus communis]NMG72303.1 threonine synthase [Parazoarcus communis SWub3 = DSM 12120]PZA16404.1 threonine synthase [Azoarcus communis] [Parazoarcus communis SWub3 = DSM 12120]